VAVYETTAPTNPLYWPLVLEFVELYAKNPLYWALVLELSQGLRMLSMAALIQYTQYSIRSLLRTQGASGQLAKRIFLGALWMGAVTRLVLLVFTILYRPLDPVGVYAAYLKDTVAFSRDMYDFQHDGRYDRRLVMEVDIILMGMPLMISLPYADLLLVMDFVLREETAI
jgi:hypothetical protein